MWTFLATAEDDRNETDNRYGRRRIADLEAKGAVYKDEAVVLAGKIITANGPAAAEKFGEAIVETLRSP